MSTLKSIIFETLLDPEEYYETAEALRDLDRQYQHFTRTVWKASKQLLKFDEIDVSGCVRGTVLLTHFCPPNFTLHFPLFIF